jgi:hypothetical protein
VYLEAAPAAASNMGFKLEREFKLEEDDLNRLYQNLYYVSFPLFNGLDPNLANTAASNGNKCVNDPGSALAGDEGPTVGDDFLNADDALCDLWTSRDGKMDISHWIPNDAVGAPATGAGCSPEVRTAENTSFGVRFTGTFTGHTSALVPIAAKDWRTDEYRGVAYQINVGDRRGTASPLHLNRAVIVGSHDPSFAGRAIESVCIPAREFLNVPYHTMYRTADEILCGLGPPSGDWVDVVLNASGNPGSDGMPDTCPNGVFDETAPRGYQISIQTFDNVKDGSLPPGGGTIPSDNTSMGRIANLNSFGFLIFSGPNFNLIPGEGYRLNIPQSHTSTLWRSPHF